MTQSRRRVAFFLFVSLGFVPAAWAHHSFSNFDMSKTMTIAGTVRALEWTNPHVWLWIDVPDGKGGSTPWGLEGAAVGEMGRQGWSRSKVVKGQKISAQMHPLRDGQPGGSLGKTTFADGSSLGGTLALKKTP